jgi:hypothetical protein
MTDCYWNSALQKHRLELCLAARLVRIRRRSSQPAFDLLKGYRVLRGWLADLDLQNSRRTNLLEPRICSKQLYGQDGSLIEAFRLNFRPVFDLPVVDVRDEACPETHGREGYHAFRRIFALKNPAA